MTSALQDNPGSETSDTEGKNKGQKRKRSSNFDSPFYEKRRSARVSNSQKVNMIYFIPDVTCSCKLIYVEMFMYFDTFLKFIIKKLYDFQLFNVTMICSRIITNYWHMLFLLCSDRMITLFAFFLVFQVRNTFTRREEERVNFREILETFIPSTLR